MTRDTARAPPLWFYETKEDAMDPAAEEVGEEQEARKRHEVQEDTIHIYISHELSKLMLAVNQDITLKDNDSIKGRKEDFPEQVFGVAKELFDSQLRDVLHMIVEHGFEEISSGSHELAEEVSVTSDYACDYSMFGLLIRLNDKHLELSKLTGEAALSRFEEITSGSSIVKELKALGLNFVFENEVKLGADLLEDEQTIAMEKGRVRFEGRHRQLSVKSNYYWKGELPSYVGKVKAFNATSNLPEVSIVILALANRLNPMLLKRMEEIKETVPKGMFEVNIVLANPEEILPEDREMLEQHIQNMGYPVKLIESRKNTIATNRNIGTAESKGNYLVLLDDDVRLVGSVVSDLMNALRTYPQIGAAQAVAYDPDTNEVFKPKPGYVKYAIDEQVVVSNSVVGMIMATRMNIARAIPFVPFWPNCAEDVWFGIQMKRLGFYPAYVT